MLLNSRNQFFQLFLGMMFLMVPNLVLAQEAVPSSPVVDQAAPTEAPNDEQKSFLQRAKEKAAAAATAAKEKASATATAAKEKAAAMATAAKEAAAAAAVAKEKAAAAAAVAKEKAAAAATAIKEKAAQATQATKNALGVNEPEATTNVVPVEAPKQEAKPKVKFVTNLGEFTVELDAEKAPVTVKNFMNYVDSGFYENTIFHRVISGFMIQGGGFTADMNQKTTKAPIILEANNGLSNLRGTIAMARTSNPNSATSQFFINVVHNRNLDRLGGGYAVFGEVIEGIETVDKIRAVQTAPKAGHRDVPVDTVVIQSATRL